MPFLCSGCEQVFSPWEGKFSERLFLPLHRNEGNSFTYGAWGLKFASSVVWRVLVESLEHGRGRLTAEQARFVDKAAQTWRAFLLGTVQHPGRFEVHAIPLDVVPPNIGPDVSPFINRYLIRSAEAEIVAGGKEVLVYAKLCRILLIGHVVVDAQARWRESRLSVAQGVLSAKRDCYLPIGLQQYMNQRAKRSAEALASQSARQKSMLRGRLQADLSRLAGSEVFRAMRADVARSGSHAFAVTGDLSSAATVDDGSVELHET
jgi:hypothetical protein